jgi:class 3 adenylate cyclase
MDVSDPSGTRPIPAERKLVAVLICELDLPTASSTEQDLAQVAGDLGRVKAEVVRYAGIVAEVMGDTVVAVFGVPRAGERPARPLAWWCRWPRRAGWCGGQLLGRRTWSMR